MRFTARLGTPSSVPGRIVLNFGRIINASATSELALGQSVSVTPDYLTAFDVAIPLLGFTNDTQGSAALVHALLQCAGRYAPRHQYGCPFDDVIAELERIGVNPHALDFLRQYMHSARDAYVRRN